MHISIPKNKEERIYRAAIDEFADEGYKNASTNNIVKESEISKGTLFNYFGNKKTLYLYVVKRALGVLEKDLVSNMNDLSNDMFERIVQCQRVKMKSILRYPKECKVVIQCFTIEEEEFKEELKDEYEYYEKMALELTTKNIDYSKFKDGVDVNKVFNALLLMSYGYKDIITRKYRDDMNLMVKDSDNLIKELNSYMDLIKENVYK